MIIDSHAHYTNPCYQKPFRYLTWSPEGYAMADGRLPELLQSLADAGIPYSIEPGVSLASCRELLDFCARHPGRIFPAIGVHPTRCLFEKWEARKELDALAAAPGVIAIGETGLDYHYKREDQHRIRQHFWFLHQLNLAQRLRLPVILHVRDAHRDALRILKHHPARKLGGVVHCFTGTPEEALEYVKLGYHIGLGGAILQQEARAGRLWEAIARIPLDRILVETDAPYVLPYCKDVLPSKQLRRCRNTSLILPAVIEKIARLKGLSPEDVERAATENCIRLFGLELRDDG